MGLSSPRPDNEPRARPPSVELRDSTAVPSVAAAAAVTKAATAAHTPMYVAVARHRVGLQDPACAAPRRSRRHHQGGQLRLHAHVHRRHACAAVAQVACLTRRARGGQRGGRPCSSASSRRRCPSAQTSAERGRRRGHHQGQQPGDVRREAPTAGRGRAAADIAKANNNGAVPCGSPPAEPAAVTAAERAADITKADNVGNTPIKFGARRALIGRRRPRHV